MEASPESLKMLKELLASQHLAVLGTQQGGQPYNSLVAFAETDDISYIIFVTSRNTQKYANISADGRVALLVDSRGNKVTDFNSAVALTLIGKAVEASGTEREYMASIYTGKHPNLVEFVSRKDSAVMQMIVSDYIVARFDRVERLQR